MESPFPVGLGRAKTAGDLTNEGSDLLVSAGRTEALREGLTLYS